MVDDWHTLTAMSAESSPSTSPEISLVIPVYNGAGTIGSVVEEIKQVFAAERFEIILVNDGSQDASESVCQELAAINPDQVTALQLSRNFGEHNAVLAGLAYARGDFAAVLDDDGQHPPAEIRRMLSELKRGDYDVVYGHYIEKRHSWFRNIGSRFNDRVATWMLGKPRELYLSSFKVMNRFVVEQIIKYRGPYPYADGLIYRTTRRIGQIPVTHRVSSAERSRYNLHRLVRLWLNMFLNFSVAPLRLSVYVGLITSCFSVVALSLILIDKLWIQKDLTLGIPTVLGSIVCFSGIQLMMLGLVGEYLGRLYLDQTGTPQYIVRHSSRPRPESGKSG